MPKTENMKYQSEKKRSVKLGWCEQARKFEPTCFLRWETCLLFYTKTNEIMGGEMNCEETLLKFYNYLWAC